jgi:hypothetical protein
MQVSLQAAIAGRRCSFHRKWFDRPCPQDEPVAAQEQRLADDLSVSVMGTLRPLRLGLTIRSVRGDESIATVSWACDRPGCRTSQCQELQRIL